MSEKPTRQEAAEMYLYLCDPEKNKECSKTACHINGGMCWCTSNKEFEEDDDNGPT